MALLRVSKKDASFLLVMKIKDYRVSPAIDTVLHIAILTDLTVFGSVIMVKSDYVI